MSGSPEKQRLAYADPPYLGCCGLYGHRHEVGDWSGGAALLDADYGCWDRIETHRDLIDYLVRAFPDGWALSASVPSLKQLLPFCPLDVRVAAWVKTFGAFKRGVRPAYMWEPVIFRGGRNPSNGHRHPPPDKGGKQTTPKDFTITVEEPALPEPITLRKGLTGVKPEIGRAHV